MATTTTAQEVTREQINACQRWEDGNGKVFYQVQSESDPTGYYKVQWNARYHVLGCNCRAGRDGIACKHLRWVMAAEAEYKEDVRRMRLGEQARAEADPQVQREIAEQTVAEGQARLAELDAKSDDYSAEAARREHAAVARHGRKAYEREPLRRDEQGRILR